MRLLALAFFCGVVSLLGFSRLPNMLVIVALWFMLIAAIKLNRQYPICYRFLGGVLLGLTWTWWVAHERLMHQLPSTEEGKNLILSGYIASIPSEEMHGTQFLFSLKSTTTLQGQVRLLWDHPSAALQVGDEWRFTVRLKRPYGTRNPGGFDYEAFAFQAGIMGNGYVVAKQENTWISSHWYHYPIARARAWLAHHIQQTVPETNTSKWLLALTIGERNHIEAADWQVLRNTGTNHLMAIAGLHIGFMAFLAAWCCQQLWRRSMRLTLLLPAQQAGAVAALSMALLYSAMVGFSIPTQRACSMLFMCLFALLVRRQIMAWHAWSVALLIVLIANPLSVLTESFWLSFGSVALIIYGVGGRLAPTGLWWKWGRIQWVIALGLVPMSIGLFQQCSLVAFAANLIAIPWVGCLIVPLCFVGCVCLTFSATVGGWILQGADHLLAALWVVLSAFASLPHAVWYQFIPSVGFISAGMIGVAMLLLPIGAPGRWLGIIWLLPIVLYKAPQPPPGDVWLTVLDVGQGLAAVVQTANHVLVFDAGPRFGPSFDMGESVVVPYLHAIQQKSVDKLVVSHGDNDHIGGAAAVLQQIPTQRIETSVTTQLPGSELCARGMTWQWDRVTFQYLYPTPANLGLNNDSSCVLRVETKTHAFLLTGDIQKLAEKTLLDYPVGELRADILVAPHHGSKTSAYPPFVARVAPHMVVFPVGYRNRYHFPHPTVVRAYQERGVEQYDTATAGALQFQLTDNAPIQQPTRYRVDHLAYWHH